MNACRVLVLFSFLAGFSAVAGNTPTVSNLTNAEADAVIKNFGNAIAFRPVEPPSANGKIWGLGLGLAFNATSSGDVNAVLAAHGNSQGIAAVPMGDVVLVVQGPLGIGAEVGFLPRMSIGGFSAKRTAFNLKWSFTDLFLRELTPFDAAVRVGFGRNEFSYSQTVSGVQDRVEFDSKAFRLELAVSRKVLFLEPYLGLGLLRTSSTLANTAAVTLYNFTSASSYDYAKSSFVANLGAEARLVFLTFGAQVEWAFGETNVAAKLGFKF